VGSWAVVHEATTRLPGQAASGQSLSADVVLGDLQKARTYVSKGDVLDAVKSYEAVLSADPGQINATTELGWVLAQTGQPALLKQGVQLLTSAENSNPSFADAHLYRGLALLSEDDYSDAIPELRWYLDHKPDPQLASSVKSTLQRAEASAKSAARSTSTTTKA
jgi:cytochrome c-type biogenesis protein CcmH/NrfG